MDNEDKGEEHLTFTLMMKKGHKSQVSNVPIPLYVASHVYLLIIDLV